MSSPFLWNFIQNLNKNKFDSDPWTTKSVNEESDKVMIKFKE